LSLGALDVPLAPGRRHEGNGRTAKPQQRRRHIRDKDRHKPQKQQPQRTHQVPRGPGAGIVAREDNLGWDDQQFRQLVKGDGVGVERPVHRQDA
jgi:hypothetical protein